MTELRDVDVLIAELADGVTEHLRREARGDPLMIGIRTGGVWVAERLHRMLGVAQPLGTLNINFYRDDFTRIGLHPRIAPSNLPFDIDQRHILLVDDVLYTGRTIRAALNEIFDYGRPASVTLAVLVERGGRELPIQPDVLGQHLHLTAGEYVKLTGPQPLALEIRRRS
jgi:pyrimidine operon attenuation protein/uracil phosphoribosyltransferase